MPTLGERVAVLTAQLEDVLAELNGGPGVPWKRSIRGRLHSMEEALANAARLDEAAKEVRAALNEQRQANEARGDRLLNRWVQWCLALGAVVTAVCAVIGAVSVLAGA